MATPGEIPKEFINAVGNYVANFKCVAFVYKKIIELTWTKKDSETIADYMKRVKCGHFKSDHKKTADEYRMKWMNVKGRKEKLQHTKLDKLDVSILSDLLPEICYEKILRPGTDEWKNIINDESRVEFWLERLKVFRNDVSHDYAKTSKNLFMDDIRISVNKSLEIFCKLYGKDSKIRNDLISTVEQEFDIIIKNVTKDQNAIVIYCRDRLINDCAKEAEKKEQILIPLPGMINNYANLRDVLHTVRLSIERESEPTNGIDEDSTSVEYFQADKLFENAKKQFIVITGIPGSGKSTLMLALNHKLIVETAYTFNIIIFIECRMTHCNDLGELLQMTYNEYLGRVHKYDVMKALQQVETVAFIIDGYDEVNKNSKALVDQVLHLCEPKSNWRCLISGRKHATKDVEVLLSKRNFSYDTVSILPISNTREQEEFLRRFDKSDECVNAFRKLGRYVKEAFVSPILLLMFKLIVTFIDPNNLRNELDVYDAFIRWAEEQIRFKLLDYRCPADTWDIAEDILTKLSDVSLELYQKQIFYLPNKEFKKLEAECKKLCVVDVVFEDLISCIIAPEHKAHSHGETNYQFPHLSIQEHMVVRTTMRRLKERSAGDAGETVLAPLLPSISCEHLKTSLGIDIDLANQDTDLER